MGNVASNCTLDSGQNLLGHCLFVLESNTAVLLTGGSNHISRLITVFFIISVTNHIGDANVDCKALVMY